MTDQEILDAYPSLTPADLAAAGKWVSEHQPEVDLLIEQNEQA